MLDFKDFVREHLELVGLDLEAEEQIVAEIADHMTDAYDEARETGASEFEALSIAESPFFHGIN